MIRLRSKIETFYNSLSEEKATFRLSLHNILESQILIIEEFDNRIVGLAGLRAGANFFLVVKDSYQNKGLGKRLTSKVINKAVSEKYDYIVLTVFSSNIKALHIYKKLGFKKVYSVEKDNQILMLMVLPLGAKGFFFIFGYKMANLFFGKINRESSAWHWLIQIRKLV